MYEGNVETCINGTYSSICDVGWDDIEAQLICNALGYAEPFYRKLILLMEVSRTRGTVVDGTARYRSKINKCHP